MKDNLKPNLLANLDNLINSYNEILTRVGSIAGIYTQESAGFVTAALFAIDRITGPNSQYTFMAKKSLEYVEMTSNAHHAMPALYSIIKSLRNDLDAGYLTSTRELIHGEIFDDFLEMADYLFSKTYITAAAVVVGSVLESHLRQLCTKNNIDVDKPTGEHKAASSLNEELAKAGVYGKNEQKIINGWQGIRNSAAHGNPAEYTKDQVGLMLQGIRQFMALNPA